MQSRVMSVCQRLPQNETSSDRPVVEGGVGSGSGERSEELVIHRGWGCQQTDSTLGTNFCVYVCESVCM